MPAGISFWTSSVSEEHLLLHGPLETESVIQIKTRIQLLYPARSSNLPTVSNKEGVFLRSRTSNESLIENLAFPENQTSVSLVATDRPFPSAPRLEYFFVERWEEEDPFMSHSAILKDGVSDEAEVHKQDAVKGRLYVVTLRLFSRICYPANLVRALRGITMPSCASFKSIVLDQQTFEWQVPICFTFAASTPSLFTLVETLKHLFYLRTPKLDTMRASLGLSVNKGTDQHANEEEPIAKESWAWSRAAKLSIPPQLLVLLDSSEDPWPEEMLHEDPQGYRTMLINVANCLHKRARVIVTETVDNFHNCGGLPSCDRINIPKFTLQDQDPWLTSSMDQGYRSPSMLKRIQRSVKRLRTGIIYKDRIVLAPPWWRNIGIFPAPRSWSCCPFERLRIEGDRIDNLIQGVGLRRLSKVQSHPIRKDSGFPFTKRPLHEYRNITMREFAFDRFISMKTEEKACLCHDCEKRHTVFSNEEPTSCGCQMQRTSLDHLLEIIGAVGMFVSIKAVLEEKTIVVVSRDHSKAASATVSLRCLLTPLTWPFPCATVSGQATADSLIDAPYPLVIGSHKVPEELAVIWSLARSLADEVAANSSKQRKDAKRHASLNSIFSYRQRGERSFSRSSGDGGEGSYTDPLLSWEYLSDALSFEPGRTLPAWDVESGRNCCVMACRAVGYDNDVIIDLDGVLPFVLVPESLVSIEIPKHSLKVTSKDGRSEIFALCPPVRDYLFPDPVFHVAEQFVQLDNFLLIMESYLADHAEATCRSIAANVTPNTNNDLLVDDGQYLTACELSTFAAECLIWKAVIGEALLGLLRGFVADVIHGVREIKQKKTLMEKDENNSEEVTGEVEFWKHRLSEQAFSDLLDNSPAPAENVIFLLSRLIGQSFSDSPTEQSPVVLRSSGGDFFLSTMSSCRVNVKSRRGKNWPRLLEKLSRTQAVLEIVGE